MKSATNKAFQTDAIAVDKSYLLGAPKSELEAVFKTFDVVMTEALFFELLTTEMEQRQRCFVRIPQGQNPMLLVPNIGPILRWEVENGRPLHDLREIALQEAFRFNPRLPNADFDLGEQQAIALEEWKQAMSEWVENYSDHARTTHEVFPTLAGYSPGQDASEIDAIKQQVVSNPEVVATFYEGLEGWPAFEQIDSTWALYKWVQIRLLAALDHFRKYGAAKICLPAKYIENEYIDLEYCLVGCLCGHLATRDSGMAARFMSLCPTGILIQ